jgi:hypothetical protein
LNYNALSLLHRELCGLLERGPVARHDSAVRGDALGAVGHESSKTRLDLALTGRAGRGADVGDGGAVDAELSTGERVGAATARLQVARGPDALVVSAGESSGRWEHAGFEAEGAAGGLV